MIARPALLAAVIAALSGVAAGQNRGEAAGVGQAEGDRLLERAGAQDLFVNETDPSSLLITLHHRPSGFACVFQAREPLNKVTVLASPVRGDAVECTTQRQGGTRSVVLRRTAEPLGVLAAAEARDLAARNAASKVGEPVVAPAGALAMSGRPTWATFPYASVSLTTQATWQASAVVRMDDWAVIGRLTQPRARAGDKTDFEDWLYLSLADRTRRLGRAQPSR